MRFQMSFSGWVLCDWSQARTAISLAPRRSSTSTSTDQKHQHQCLPYLVGFSGRSSTHTSHVSPPSSVTSTRESKLHECPIEHMLTESCKLPTYNLPLGSAS
uniref:Uncharacterized protein n=1 Tax=Oryza nivara TaxID=4536 RepID=A0A0E0ID60_ORYNI